MHSSISIFYLCFLLHLTVTLLSISPLPVSASSAERCHPQDKEALLQIKKELNNPTALSSWDPTTNCCRNWQGVDCDNGLDYRVYSLSLSNMDISHPLPIPPSIANLPYLYSLDIISVSNLTGPIPQSITNSSLTNFHYLKISHIPLLSGTIPEYLSNLSSLFTLELSYTNLSGPIPPSLSRMPKLDGLTLQGNSLSGSIPDSFGSFSNKFTYLDLSSNQISGQIPKSLGNLNLAFVNLTKNRLEGDASVLFGAAKNTQKIILARNSFAFDFGKVGLSSDLNTIDVRHNRIYGTLPEELTELKYLKKLNVSYNSLCGKIPEGGKMNWFNEYSYAHNKCLCGTPLPSCNKTNGA